jgi:hypothetical protein
MGGCGCGCMGGWVPSCEACNPPGWFVSIDGAAGRERFGNVGGGRPPCGGA